MTFEELSNINKGLATTPIEHKGKTKEYVQVNTRVLAFRELFPNGTIKTEILDSENGRIIIRADIYNEDMKLLSTGTAYEIEGTSFINKMSYIENCETSAVGRALGFLGIGIENSIHSAEELENAKQASGLDDPISEAKLNTLIKMCKSDGVNEKLILDNFKIKELSALTNSQFVTIANNWSKDYKKCEVQEK